jgi:NUDIX domain
LWSAGLCSSWLASRRQHKKAPPFEGDGADPREPVLGGSRFAGLPYGRSMRRSSGVAGAKRVQYAALPYRLSGRSRTEVMLVTSRGTQRWIIPKGWPQRGRAPHDSAAREAFEEAGIDWGGR